MSSIQEKRSAVGTMKAAAVDRFGGIDELTLHTLPVPEAGPDEVLVRVHTAGVGVWDPYEREGGFVEMSGRKPEFPYVLGSDASGTVVEAGRKVRRFKEGDRVYLFSLLNPKGGSYAEYVAVPEKYVSPIPGGLSMEQAGVMPVDAMTALRGLEDRLGLKEGESILILGASGGIGHLAVQLAKRMGARVLAAASGGDGAEFAKRLGADAAIDARREDVFEAARSFAPDGVDAALLTAGGAPAKRAIESLRKGGRAAYPNGVEPAPKGRPGVTVESYDGTPDGKAVKRLNRLIESGPFEAHVARTFALSEAAEAHRALESHYLGKLALRPARRER